MRKMYMTSASATTEGTDAVLDPANPFAAPSTLPYGLPDFAAIREEHYEPAVVAGMAAHRAEVEAIATNPEPATVENTLEALERAGQLLGRAATAFYGTLPADSTPGLEDIQERLAPQLAAHQDAISMDARLYARVQSLAGAAGPAPRTRHRLPARQAHARSSSGPASRSPRPTRSGCASSTPGSRRCRPASDASSWRAPTRRACS